MTTFSIRRDPTWRPLLVLFGGSADDSYVEITNESVRFRFGRWFDRTVPRSNIEVASRREWPWWMGVGWRTDMRGLVGLIGSSMGVVEVKLREPARRWGIFPCESIAVSLDDPIGFIEALTPAVPRKTKPTASRRTIKNATKASPPPKRTTGRKRPVAESRSSNGVARSRKKA